MIVSRLLSIALAVPSLAAPAIGALIVWLWIVAPDSAFGEPLRSNVWITYAPGGVISSTKPQGDGSDLVSVGGLQPPIFSVRLRSTEKNGSVEGDLATPRGFDTHHRKVADISPDGWSDNPSSDPGVREARLERALTHHRPVVRVRIGPEGPPRVRRSPELSRHEACARRLLRSTIEAQIAAAKNTERRRSQQKRLQRDYLAPVSAPVDHAALLLRLVRLSLPSFAGPYDQGPEATARKLETLSAQHGWRAQQIRAHGRPVRLRLDLLSAGRSPAASLCRSLAYEEISELRGDTCAIEGVVDRRDGWPLTLSISRRGESASGATENQSRSFDRITPLQGFVPPSNPCSTAR